jgi:uncharacterized protein (TIGR03083 family)
MGQSMLGYARSLEVRAAEGELLAEAVDGASAEAPVPTCPGLTIGGTARHVGSVYRMVLAWLLEGGRPETWSRDPPPGQTGLEYFREGHQALLEHLSAHDPEEPASSWWPEDETYGFWLRRMVHETTVHRVDVQSAAGRELTEIEDDIAVDGVDEVLALWFGRKLPMIGLSGTKAGSVGVKTGGHHWIARAGPGETTAKRCSAEEAEQADSLVSAAPEKVYLWLWGRTALTSVTVSGHHDAAGQLWALLRLATR